MTLRQFWARDVLPHVVVAVAAITQACALSSSLVGGTCAAGYAQCGEQCIPVANDSNNCGACGHVCSGRERMRRWHM